jgi:heparin binding hemagglutinin HbhA
MSVTTELKKTTADLRKTATDTGYFVAGLTDLAVERARSAQARAAAVRAELDKVKVDAELKRLRGSVTALPTAVVSVSIDAATKAEEAFGELTARGKSLVERVSSQRSTQDLLRQGKATLSKGKAAVTTVRRGTAATATAAKAAVTTADRDAAKTTKAVKTTTRKQTAGTKAAAKRTTTTASKSAAASKTATKAAVTSAAKTADAAVDAVQDAAAKVGD